MANMAVQSKIWLLRQILSRPSISRQYATSVLNSLYAETNTKTGRAHRHERYKIGLDPDRYDRKSEFRVQRDFTEEELAADRQLRESVDEMDKKDCFGTFEIPHHTQTSDIRQRRSQQFNYNQNTQTPVISDRRSNDFLNKRHQNMMHGMKSDNDSNIRQSTSSYFAEIRSDGTAAATTSRRSDGNKHRSNNFGFLAGEPETTARDEVKANRDSEETGADFHMRLSPHDRRHTQQYYGLVIKRLGKQGKVKEAVEVLEERMLKRDRVLPSPFCFTILIGILGRAGYTHKAFQLFRKMRDLGMPPEDPTITALFNACANSPWPGDGLRKLRKLRSWMKDKGRRANFTNYSALIRAYGVCGDLQAAFDTMDELCARFPPREESFNALLNGCCSDTQSGYLHGLQVWQMMRRMRISPSLNTYHLFLRTMRDCGMGVHERRQVTENKQENRQNLANNEHKDYLPYEKNSQHIFETEPKDSMGSVHKKSDGDVAMSYSSLLTSHEPDLMQSLTDTNSNLPAVPLSNISTSENRLALVGGIEGLLNSVDKDNIKMDIVTLTHLAEIIASSTEAENELIQMVNDRNTKPDVDFFNHLIRKRNARQDYDGAKALMPLLNSYLLHPNLRTFGCLAMGCKKKVDGMQLLTDIQEFGLQAGVEIYNILFWQSNLDFGYKMSVLEQLEEQAIEPDLRTLQLIERAVEKANMELINQEKSDSDAGYFASEYFKKNFRLFMIRYRVWLHKTKIPEKTHPWANFRDEPKTADAVQQR